MGREVLDQMVVQRVAPSQSLHPTTSVEIRDLNALFHHIAELSRHREMSCGGFGRLRERRRRRNGRVLWLNKGSFRIVRWILWIVRWILWIVQRVLWIVQRVLWVVQCIQCLRIRWKRLSERRQRGVQRMRPNRLAFDVQRGSAHRRPRESHYDSRRCDFIEPIGEEDALPDVLLEVLRVDRKIGGFDLRRGHRRQTHRDLSVDFLNAFLRVSEERCLYLQIANARLATVPSNQTLQRVVGDSERFGSRRPLSTLSDAQKGEKRFQSSGDADFFIEKSLGDLEFFLIVVPADANHFHSIQ